MIRGDRVRADGARRDDVREALAILRKYRSPSPKPCSITSTASRPKPRSPAIRGLRTGHQFSDRDPAGLARSGGGRSAKAGFRRSSWQRDRRRGARGRAGACRDREAGRKRGQPCDIPCALISGGETTVTVRGNGRGGRNAEFLLASVGACRTGGIAALAGDTDGIDGSEDNAGALLLPDTPARAGARGRSQGLSRR